MRTTLNLSGTNSGPLPQPEALSRSPALILSLPELFTAELGRRAFAWLIEAEKEYRRLSNAADLRLDNYREQ